MQKLYKTIFGLIISVMWALPLLSVTANYSYPYDKGTWWATTETQEILKTENQGSDSIIVSLMDRFGIYVYTSRSGWAMHYISLVINYFLAIATSIALIIMIYGFYSMYFSKWEDGWGRAKKIVATAAVALFILWISWYVTSWMFYVFSQAV